MYETGIFVAFLLWCYSLIFTIIMVNSKMNRNLHKIGKKISFSGNVVDIVNPKPSKITSFILYFLLYLVSLILIIFSWLYVFVVVSVMLYRWYKNLGEPTAFKEYRWKMKNIDMSLDDIIKELMKMESIPESDFPKIKLEWQQYLKNKNL